MNDIEFKIQRYEIYPPTNSDSYVVGFKIIDKLLGKFRIIFPKYLGALF